jgi:hypothetical protein
VLRKPAPAYLRPIWVTSFVDDHDHAVTDEEMVAGMKSRRGAYKAICGDTIVPPAMTAPPQPRCHACTAKLRAQRRAHVASLQRYAAPAHHQRGSNSFNSRAT